MLALSQFQLIASFDSRISICFLFFFFWHGVCQKFPSCLLKSLDAVFMVLVKAAPAHFII